MSEGWERELRRALTGRGMVVVLGLGSTLRGDDGFGPLAVQALEQEITSDRLRVLDAGTVPENYLGAVRAVSPSLVVLLDAAHMGKRPGHAELLPRDRLDGVSSSTHTMSLGMLVDYLAEEMGCQVVVLGVQPESVEIGAKLSPAVMGAVESMVREFRSAFG